MSLFFPTRKSTPPSSTKPSSSVQSSTPRKDGLKGYGIVTNNELDRVFRRLRGDMSSYKIQRLKDAAVGFADRDLGKGKGITAREAKELLDHLAENRHRYNFSDEDLSDFQNAINKEL